MNIGSKIIEIRKEHNLSQEEFSKLFYVTRQTVSSWECGKSYPDIETIIKISDKFKIPLDYLLKGDKKMIKRITKKMQNNKYLIISIGVILFLIITIPLGIFVYRRLNPLPLVVVPDNNDSFTFKSSDIAHIDSAHLKYGDYVDMYVSFGDDNPLYNEALFKGILILNFQSQDGSLLKDGSNFAKVDLAYQMGYKDVFYAVDIFNKTKEEVVVSFKKNKDVYKRFWVNEDLRKLIMSKTNVIGR